MKPPNTHMIGQFLVPRGRWVSLCRQVHPHRFVPRNGFTFANTTLALARRA